MSKFKLPDLGEGLQDAEIVTWHVSPGDHVVVDQPLLSVETAKAVIEIPSPESGNVTELFAGVGDIVPIGGDLVSFDEAPRTDAGSVVGSLPESTSSIKASPAVRHLATEKGIDLAEIKGSGPEGTILSRDLESAVPTVQKNHTVLPVSGVRRAMALSMRDAGKEVVAATVTEEAIMRTATGHEDLTIQLVRAIEAAIKEEPGLNAWYIPEKNERWLQPHLDLAIAMDTVDGLFAPVIRDTASLSDDEVRKSLEHLKKQVGDRSISADQLNNPTFTLSNFGMIAGLHAALVIVPPQLAILGVGRLFKQPDPEQEKLHWQKALPLSLTFDHRVVTGGEASRFLRAVVQHLEKESS